jgi:hypothetical protein
VFVAGAAGSVADLTRFYAVQTASRGEMVRGVEAIEFGREGAKDGALIGASSRANPMPESSTLLKSSVTTTTTPSNTLSVSSGRIMNFYRV